MIQKNIKQNPNRLPNEDNDP
jgi:hypothetical protein